jgi:hypothetical protein
MSNGTSPSPDLKTTLPLDNQSAESPPPALRAPYHTAATALFCGWVVELSTRRGRAGGAVSRGGWQGGK